MAPVSRSGDKRGVVPVVGLSWELRGQNLRSESLVFATTDSINTNHHERKTLELWQLRHSTNSQVSPTPRGLTVSCPASSLPSSSSSSPPTHLWLTPPAQRRAGARFYSPLWQGALAEADPDKFNTCTANCSSSPPGMLETKFYQCIYVWWANFWTDGITICS